MLVTEITYFGQPCVVACDAWCEKAWGIQHRPRIEYDADEPDDIAYLPDGELGSAPVDPGTYEGGHAKPHSKPTRHNKWCVRECERSVTVDPGTPIVLSDWSVLHYNMPWLHKEA